MRKICYITGTRADYGLMNRTLNLAREMDLEVSICVTGMHLLPHYGNTVEEIERDGHRITARVPVHMDGTSGASMARAISAEIAGFTTALERERPDIVLVLGDRGEMLAGAIAAVHLNIIVVHIHGGERSGTIDDSVRHAISKLSHYHFVATEGSRERLIRMGEKPECVLVTGAPGLDGLRELAAKTKDELCAEEGLDSQRPVALVVFHPVVQEAHEAGRQMEEILEAVLGCGLQAMCLEPNADAGGLAISKALDRYRDHRDVRGSVHLPRSGYVSWMAASDVMVGNSSSGIIEAASLNLPVINVGSRQCLRERNGNVLDVPPERNAIVASLGRILSGAFAGPWENVYGDGRARERIVDLLCRLPMGLDILRKVNEY